MVTYHTSRWILSPIYLAATILLILPPFIGIGFIIWPTSILLIIVCEFLIKKEILELDANSIAHRKGLFSRVTTTVDYRNITDVEVRQNVIQRMLNYGNLEITTPGTGEAEIVCKDIAEPLEISKLIKRQQERLSGVRSKKIARQPAKGQVRKQSGTTPAKQMRPRKPLQQRPRTY